MQTGRLPKVAPWMLMTVTIKILIRGGSETATLTLL
jgi:hypothetical protein